MRAPRPAARILLVASNFPPVLGGSAAVYAAIAGQLAPRVIVLAAQRNYVDGQVIAGWAAHDAVAPGPVVRLPLLRSRLHPAGGAGLARLADAAIRLRLAARVFGLVLLAGVRTVCVGELLASAWLLRLLRLLRRCPGVRTLAYVHGEEITTTDGYDPDHARARAALRAADRIIVVSGFTEAAVRDLLGPAAQPDRVRRIANGVDTGRFRTGPRDPALAARLGLATGFVFVSVCRLVPRKGIDQALRGFAAIASERPDCLYLVVGEGPAAAALRALAGSLGVADRVVFAGAAPAAELAAHYRLGDVFVMPNRTQPDGDTEGFGLVFLEANACGLPVIAGRDGGSPEAVQDGVNGLLVDGGSVETIAAAMAALHDDAALRARLAAGGAAVAAASDWSARAQLFAAACDDPLA
jgi:phosphatidylinositol alpha-1,6-mannosyltransferase